MANPQETGQLKELKNSAAQAGKGNGVAIPPTIGPYPPPPKPPTYASEQRPKVAYYWISIDKLEPNGSTIANVEFEIAPAKSVAPQQLVLRALIFEGRGKGSLNANVWKFQTRASSIEANGTTRLVLNKTAQEKAKRFLVAGNTLALMVKGKLKNDALRIGSVHVTASE